MTGNTKLNSTQNKENSSKRKEQMKLLYQKGKEQEQLLTKRLEQLQEILGKEIEKRKQKTQSEIKTTLEKKEPSEKEKKRINEKRILANKTIQTAEKLIHDSNLDAKVDPQNLLPLIEIINQAKTVMQKQEITEKEIEGITNEINKKINEFIKKYPQHLQIIQLQEPKESFFATRKEKIHIKIRKRKLEKELKYIDEIISYNLEGLPLDKSSYFVEIVNQTRDFLKKPGIASKEIDERSQTLKDAFEQLKFIHPLKEKIIKKIFSAQERRTLEKNKEKIQNMINFARKLIQKGYLSSEFTEGGTLINLSYEAEDMLQNKSAPLEDINKIAQKLEEEIDNIAGILNEKIISENKKAREAKNTIIESTDKINDITKGDDTTLLQIQTSIEELRNLLNDTTENNKKIEKELNDIK